MGRLTRTDSGLRTGLRWKLSAAIAMVGALVLALSLVVHNAARVSMLDNARDLADERIQVAQRMYESGRQQNPGAFGVRINDPSIPGPAGEGLEAARHVRRRRPERRAGHMGRGAAEGRQVLSLDTRFTDRSADIMQDLDQALVIGSIALSCSAAARSGSSSAARCPAAAQGRVGGEPGRQGETDVRVRDAIGGVVRDETDDLAAVCGRHGGRAAAAHRGRARVTADIAHELRPGHGPADGGTPAPGTPLGAGPRPCPGDAHTRGGRPGGGPARRRLRAGRCRTSCWASSS